MTNTIYWPAAGGGLKGQIAATVQGANEPYTIACQRLDGSAYNLTGFTVTGTKSDQAGNVYLLTGTLTPGNGTMTFEPSAADVGTGKLYILRFTAVLAGVTNKSYGVAWNVQPDPAATAVDSPALVGVSEEDAAILADLALGLATATDGQVYTADGLGGADWESPAASASDVDDLTTTTGNEDEMVRVGALGGLEYRTPGEVQVDLGLVPGTDVQAQSARVQSLVDAAWPGISIPFA
jgi:hypothetical protein